MVYKYEDRGMRVVEIYPTATMPGIAIAISGGGYVPDDEIPGLISALQNYMSKRANQITRAASNGR
jgi:predicted nuclease with RNAse H fold